MRKKLVFTIKTLLFIILAVLMTKITPEIAYGATTSGGYDYVHISNPYITPKLDYIRITGYNGVGGDIEIPASIDGYPVTEIYEYAFSQCTSLTSVNIPSSVTVIGDCAFSDCNSLTSVTIPSSVTVISNYAFAGCNSLTSVTIPSSITGIGEKAFCNCTSLTSISLPSSVAGIGDLAFFNCKSLESITIPNNVVYIGEAVFGGCTSLVKIDVDTGNSKYSSLDGVLYSKDKKTLICYPGGKTDLLYTISSSVTNISVRAFLSCRNLTSVIIPNSVTRIEWETFRDCSSLTSVAIPNSITYIGECAFALCRSLTSITIPDSVIKIDENALELCSSLININVDAKNQNYTSENGVLYNKLMTTLICYPAAKPDFSFTIPDSVYSFSDYAFERCTNIKEFNVNSGNTRFTSLDGVLYRKFNDTTMESLERYPAGKLDSSFRIGNNVSSIDSQAFCGNIYLINVIIPSSVTRIGSQAFMRCSNLTSAKFLGNEPDMLGTEWFNECDSDFKVYYTAGSTGFDIYFYGYTTVKEVENYTISVGNITGGSISVTPTTAAEGDLIHLIITPEVGMKLKTMSLKYNDGTRDIYIIGNDIVMPAADITITAEFVKSYTIKVGAVSGGSITVFPETAAEGELVWITITPESGKMMKIGSLKYNDDTQNVEITGTRFVMPATNVTVSAEFENVPVNSYSVTVGTLTGGSITANPAAAVSGSSIYLTIVPEAGMRLKAGSLKFKDGTQDVVINGTSFVMPASDVIVSAEFEEVQSPIEDNILISITSPLAITGIANGTAKTQSALGLPSTVNIVTTQGNRSAEVVWHVNLCSYNQNSNNAQTFNVTGNVILSADVTNPNNVNLTISISISVNEGVIISNVPVVNIPTNITDNDEPTINGSVVQGWDNIIETIEDNLSNSITVDMNGSTIVDKEVFEAMKGKDIEITFVFEDGIKWTINGLDIPESTDESQLQNINFNLSINTKNIPEESLETLPGDNGIQISIAHNGTFGFNAILKIPLDNQNSGKMAYLYYYNSVTKILELQASVVIGDDGYAQFPFTHASDYVILIQNDDILKNSIGIIKVSPDKKTLYFGGTKGNNVTLKTEIPLVIKAAAENNLCEMSVTYSSSNPKVAIVTTAGKVIAKKAGKTIITAMISVNGENLNFKTAITVKNAYIKLTKNTDGIKLGESFVFQAKGYGVDAKDIIFITTKKSIITIDRTTGKAKAVSLGADYIIAKVGEIQTKVKVMVE